MISTKKKLTSLLLGASLAITPAFAKQDETIQLTDKEFFSCKYRADKIMVTDFIFKAEEKKSAPIYSQYERFSKLVEKANLEIEPLLDKLDTFPDPVPSERWDDYTTVWNQYEKLRVKRDTLLEQKDFFWNEYDTKFASAYDKAKADLDKVWEGYELKGCTKKITASQEMIKKHCPIDTKNRFCNGWDLQAVYGKK